MASSKAYLEFILDQASGVAGITYRAMMGEYILYIQGRIVGGVYDDRLLMKPYPAVCAMMSDAPQEEPYPGAKPMLLVENVDNREWMAQLFATAGSAAPAKKQKKE